MSALDIATSIVELSRRPARTLFIVGGAIDIPVLELQDPGRGCGPLCVVVRSTLPPSAVDAAARAALEAAGYEEAERLEPRSRVLEVERSPAGAAAFAEAAGRWWLDPGAIQSMRVGLRAVLNRGRPMALLTGNAIRVEAGHIGVARDGRARAAAVVLSRRVSLGQHLGASVDLEAVRAGAVDALRGFLEMAIMWTGDVDNSGGGGGESCSASANGAPG